jgi:maleate cis-trans isomerase
MPATRIGIISPTVLETIAHDFVAVAPATVRMVGVTLGMGGWQGAEYAKALAQLDEAVRYLAARRVDAILHVASPIVVAQGPGHDRVLTARMAAQAAGIPCLTTIRCALDAFAACAARRILVVTPFHDALNAQVVAYLEAEGLHVAALEGVPAHFDFLQDVPPEHLAEAARRGAAACGDAFDAVWMPSGQLRAVETVRVLEAEFGRPVIAQNHADLWAAMRAAGARGVAPGQGRLLDMLAG